MVDVNFRSYLYYPVLRTREAEMRGFQNLSEKDKSSIIPLFTLHPWPRGDFLTSIDIVKNNIGNNLCFLDLPEYDEVKKKSEENPSILEQYNNLISPENSFQNWINILKPHENVIPIIQTRNATINQTSKQVKEFLKYKSLIGFRIKSSQDVTKFISAISQLEENIDNIIIFVDEGFISRATLESKIQHSIHIINEITNEFKNPIICLLSTSFPISPISEIQNKDDGEIEILEYELFSQVGFNYSDILYGDYASIHAQVYDEQRFNGMAAPRIDYPLIYSWDIRRNKHAENRALGYQYIAESLIKDYSNIVDSSCWGEQKIAEAAKGNVFGKSPSQWISVRVNIHLKNQILSSYSLLDEITDDFYDNDE